MSKVINHRTRPENRRSLKGEVAFIRKLSPDYTIMTAKETNKFEISLKEYWDRKTIPLAKIKREFCLSKIEKRERAY